MRRLCVVAFLFAIPSNSSAQTYLPQIGYVSLQQLLGPAIPIGDGVKVSLVEAPVDGGAYFPDLNQLVGVTVNNVTGTSSAVSYHATGTSVLLAGNSGLGRGIPIMDVYEANDWLGDGLLNTYSTVLPAVETSQVVNHSWIGAFGQTSISLDALRRLDYAIERDEFVSVVAVNNGSGTTVPHLLANSYNSIVVGLTSGNSSLGPSTLDGTGRSAPHIVVPDTFTSNATPVVSAAAAMLVEAATDAGKLNAQQPEMIKALLLGGATKTEFDLTASTPSTLDNWSHSSTQPLDLRHGAGELNIYNSYNIFAAGEQEGGVDNLVKTTGWDFDTLPANSQNTYYFNILDGQTATELSILATWNRHITATPNGVNPMTLSSALANVDLRLYHAGGSLIAESVSTIDNIEHLYFPTLGPGEYAITMNTNQAWDVALTWQATLTGNAFLSVAALDSSKVTNFDSSGLDSTYADSGNGLSKPIDVTHDSAGNRYIADAVLSQIVKIDPSGVSTILADISDGVLLPTSVAMNDVDTNLYVANYISGQILQIDSAGNTTVFSNTAKGLLKPFGVAVDASGVVYVAEVDNGRILRLDGAGNATVFADATDGLVGPIAMAFGPDGDLYVADTVMSRVFRINSFGVATLFADITNGLLTPSGLAFDAAGNLFVSTYINGRIVRLDPSGNGTVFADNGLKGLFGIDIIDSMSSLLAQSESTAQFLGIEGLQSGSTIAAVPEASTLVLTGCAGILGILTLRRRR